MQEDVEVTIKFGLVEQGFNFVTTNKFLTSGSQVMTRHQRGYVTYYCQSREVNFDMH